MIQGFYTAATALNYRQKSINVVSNNMANVNTPAFKASTPKFQDAMYSAYLKEYPDNVNTHFQVGTGSYIGRIDKNMKEGALIETQEILDIGIQGQGFLMMHDQQGDVFYTRGKSFMFEPAPEGKYITDGKRNYLVDEFQNRITIPEEVSKIIIDEKGTLTYEGQEGPQRLMTINFPNPNGLSSVENGLFAVSENSGDPQLADITIRQGYLEMSNVDTAKEMTDLIKHQRIFQLNARVISTTDEMHSLANKLRR